MMVVTTSGKQKAASQESDGNNKRRTSLFCNASKNLFCFLLRDQSVVSQLSEDRRRYPQVYVCCHIKPP